MKTLLLATAFAAAMTMTAHAGPILPEQFRGDWCLADQSFHQLKGQGVYLPVACDEPGIDWLEVRRDRIVDHEVMCKLTGVRNTKRYRYRFKCEQMEGPDLPTLFHLAIAANGHLVLLTQATR
jgi:hypothetical protein